MRRGGKGKNGESRIGKQYKHVSSQPLRMGPRRAVAPQCLYDQELSQGEPIPKRPASPSMGWYHHDKLGHGWPTHAQTDDDMESPRCPTSHPSALDDNASEDEERKLSSPISLLDKCSSTRRKVLDSLRWRLEAEKSVKIQL